MIGYFILAIKQKVKGTLIFLSYLFEAQEKTMHEYLNQEQKNKQDTRQSKLDETLQQLLQRCIIVHRPAGIYGDSGVLYPLSLCSYINPISIRECQIDPPH